MGNNQSLSPNATGFLNPNFTTGNVADPPLFDDNSLVDDLTEDQFIGVIQAIINKDEVLRIIRGIALPVAKKPRKTRRSKVGRCTSETLQASIWGQLMSDIQLEIATTGVNPDSELQKTFRLRFRVLYSMFVDIVQECIVGNVFGTGKKAYKIGVDFKVLLCLRILGRNFVGDSIVEILNAGRNTVNQTFKMFVKNYSDLYYSTYVYVPEGEELDAVEKVYRYMGFPGCIGSMDVTHLHWGGCPKHLTNHCTGRYGHPTLAFNFICSHSRRIHYISNAFHGATNDITITYNDNYPRKLMQCQVHQDRVFRTFTRTGEIIYWRRAYVITDGGYPSCFSFVNPTLPNYYEYHTVLWAECSEGC